MNQELLKQGQVLLKEIEKYQKYLDIWQSATDYYGPISLIWNTNNKRGSGNVPMIIPFEECKYRSIAYYKAKVENLQTEFNNL